MARWVRRGVGIGVIAAGFCAASQFRIDPPKDTVPPGHRNQQPTHFRSTDITLQLAPSPKLQSVSQELPEVFAEETVQESYVVARSSLSGQQPPPRLSTDFQLLERPVPSVIFNELGLEHDGANTLTHTIRDGDSLEALAERYLRDADRWQELLDANADVLTSRDLLPVNTVIRIPRRQADAYHSSGHESEQAEHDKLVPVRQP